MKFFNLSFTMLADLELKKSVKQSAVGNNKCLVFLSKNQTNYEKEQEYRDNARN
jgi:hypothetical protein